MRFFIVQYPLSGYSSPAAVGAGPMVSFQGGVMQNPGIMNVDPIVQDRMMLNMCIRTASPVQGKCPHCHQDIITRVERYNGNAVWTLFTMLMILG